MAAKKPRAGRIDPSRLKTTKDLRADPENPREITPEAMAGLKASLGEFGDIAGITFNTRTSQLVAGHQRLDGLVQQHGHLPIERSKDGGAFIKTPAGEVFPIRIVDWEMPRQRVANLAANNPHIAGHFTRRLQPQLEDIRKRSAGMFESLRLRQLEAAERRLRMGRVDPDHVPDAPATPKTKPGDLYTMGGHRLLCGDSTKPDSLKPLLQGQKAQLCFTSPPYWVGKSYESQTTMAEVLEFTRQICATMAEAITKDGGRIVINTGTARMRAIDPKADVEIMFPLTWWQDALREHNWLMRHCRLWAKRGQLAAPRVSAKLDVVDQHWEKVATFLPTFYNPKGKKRGQEKVSIHWAQQGIWDDLHGQANMKQHGAAFPVELPLRYIQLYSVEAEAIFEPFSGTGTTIIAAEQLQRKCFAIEIDPVYCDIAVERWERFTGKKAEVKHAK